jgi:hypothetical protein
MTLCNATPDTEKVPQGSIPVPEGTFQIETEISKIPLVNSVSVLEFRILGRIRNSPPQRWPSGREEFYQQDLSNPRTLACCKNPVSFFVYNF